MRWPLRNQLLLPSVAIVLLAVGSLTALFTSLAVRNSTRQTATRLQMVMETVSQANFPLNSAVLERMQGLSGAHFVALGHDQQILATTLPPVERQKWPARWPASGTAVDWESLANAERWTLGDERYLVVSVAPVVHPEVQRLLVLYPESAWLHSRREAQWPPLIVGALAGLLAAVVAVWLSQRLTGRIQRLRQQVADIAAGDFRPIPALNRYQDELDELAGSVNLLTVQLAELQRTSLQAERSRLLAQWAGGLAHQLRNAAAGARMSLQLHQRRCPQTADRSLAVALRQLALMETHLKGVLSLGRLEERPRQVRDLGDLLRDVLELVQPVCEHAHVQLQLLGADQSCPCAIHDDSLRAALLNLVLNAVEAAGSGGRVEVRWTADASGVQIEIRDSGNGPPPHLAESLFEPFITSKPDGVGLGLAVARQVAQDHGGELTWFRETNRTCFRLRFAGEVGEPERKASLVPGRDPGAETPAPGPLKVNEESRLSPPPAAHEITKC